MVCQDVLTWLHNVSGFLEVITHFFTSSLSCPLLLWQHSWCMEWTPRLHLKDRVVQGLTVWFLACAHMSLLFSSQQQSSFLLNYQCTVSSLIISFFQTCYGLIFLRREAPKTYKGLEGHWERVQLICPHDSSGGAWEMRCGEKIERKATLIFGHQPFSLFSMKLVLLSAFPALLKLSRCGTL